MSKRERNMLPTTWWNKQKYKNTIRTQHSGPRVVAASAAWETWILGPVPRAGARKAGKLLNYYCSKNWSLILTVFRLQASMSLSLFVCLSLSVWMSSLPLCVCFFACEFFCPVKHTFHSCGLTCHSLCFVCKWLSAYDTLSSYVLLLLPYFTPPCASLWPGRCFPPLCVVYIYLCLHLWVSLFLLLHAFDTLCTILSVLLYISLCVPPGSSHCISLYSVRLWICASDGMCFCFCIYPWVPLGMACVGLSCLLASLYVSLTKCVSQCVRFSLMPLCWAGLWDSRQTREGSSIIYALSQTQCVRKKAQII